MSSINLGPFNINKPTLDEKLEIRKSLDLGDAALFNAQFTNSGNTLTITQPNTDYSFQFNKGITSSDVALRLTTPRSFSLTGEVYTQFSRNFDGTDDVSLITTILNESITAVKIADGAVTAAKIANSAITPQKLSSGGPSWSSSIFSTPASSSRFGINLSGPISLDLGHSRSGSGDSSINFIATTGDNSVNAQAIRTGGLNGNFTFTNYGSGDFNLNQVGAGNIIFRTNNIERLRVNGQGGLVITAPSQGSTPLEISSGVDQFANTIKLKPTSFSGSSRASIMLDDWLIGQDSGGNNTKDLFIYQVSTNTNRILVNSIGNIGIGKTNPSSMLDVNGTIKALNITTVGSITSNAGNIISGASSSAALTITQTGAGNSLVVNDNSSNPDSTPFIIRNDGGIIVGHTDTLSTREAATAQSTIIPKFQVTGTDANTSAILISRFGNGPNAPRLFFAKSRGSTPGSYTSVINDDNLGIISFGGADGTRTIEAARILVESDGAPGINSMPGRILFFTTSNTTEIPVERMRIASNGNVGIGVSNPTSKLHIVGTAQATAISVTGAEGGGSSIFGNSSDFAALTIRQNGTANALVVQDEGGDTTPFVIDSSGNVGVGTSTPTQKLEVAGTVKATAFEGPMTGTVSGNASTASKLLNPKTIAISGAITGTATSFDGSANITIATSITNGSIVDADINASAGIALSKLASGALPSAITVASANIVNGTIVNDDINASAAISGSKINPNFGSQNIITTGTLTANAGSVISGSSSADALRITQTSTSGNAFVVEDSTNPDTTPFVIDKDGKVFIGSPTYLRGWNNNQNLTIAGLGNAGISVFGTSQAVLTLNRSGGTEPGGETAIADGDVVGVINFAASDGVERQTTCARIRARATGTISDGNVPGQLEFLTWKNSQELERMVIDSDGNVGIGTTDPQTKLHVAGNIKATSAEITSTSPPSSDLSLVTKKYVDDQIDANGVKAWVVFDGSTATISDSHNITSVVLTGAGTYDINIASGTFSNGNYAVAGTASDTDHYINYRTSTSSKLQIATIDNGSANGVSQTTQGIVTVILVA